MTVDVYPVGLLNDVRHFRHERRIGRPQAFRRAIRHSLGYVQGQARRGDWRAVKNYFNGYLAEPAEFPEGVPRCGSGWTRRRARRDWERRAKAAA